ncbi:hypothetical protein K501DRAFT_337015 [Backusella circina FSU 941]|nr:hypothetical protein K501DRAFT_337015 [Backusella circina FSU 941]
MSTLSTDSRVPTFIQYDANSEKEQKVKRKRTTEPTKKPKTKRSKKDQATPVVIDNTVNIWVGAHVENELGVYSIYFGQDDNRNSTEVFQIEDVLRDDDYVSCLGALKALEISQDVEAPINIYTSYRDLPRVSAGKRGAVVYPHLVEKIKTLIAGKKEGVTVHYVSGRTASPEHSASVELATLALKNKVEKATTENEKNHVAQEETPTAATEQVTLDEMAVETDTKQQGLAVNELIVEQVAVKASVNGDDEVQQASETADDEEDAVNNDTITEAPIADAEVTTITKVTTVVKETTVEMSEEPVDTVMREVSSLSEMDEHVSKDDIDCNDDDLIQEEPSSWSLGIRSVWNVLTSPFKSRK